MGTGSCTEFRGVEHVFHRKGALAACTNPEAQVIVGHNVEIDLPGFDRELLQVEQLAIYVPKERTARFRGLTSGMLARILEGSITDWASLGSEPGPIVVYRHGGPNQERSFMGFVNACLPDTAVHPAEDRVVAMPGELSYEETYRRLEETAGLDRNALVIGLRGSSGGTLVPTQIDEKTVTVEEDYPLQFPVFLYTRKGEDARKVREGFLRLVESGRKSVRAEGGGPDR